MKKNNPKEMWQFINTNISSEQQAFFAYSKILNNDNVFEDPILILEPFNDYFVKIGQSIPNKTTYLLNLDFNLYLKNRYSQSLC